MSTKSTNQNLFTTNSSYFSRLPEPRIVNLYVFSLAFALMGKLQGKSLFIVLQPYPEVLPYIQNILGFVTINSQYVIFKCNYVNTVYINPIFDFDCKYAIDMKYINICLWLIYCFTNIIML